MTELLANHVAGRWQTGTGQGSTLLDPVLGTPLVRVDATGLDLAAAFAFARESGGKALRAMSYAQRAKLLADVAAVLQANRDAYYEISTANSGTVKNDTAVDVDGGIYTLGVSPGTVSGLHVAVVPLREIAPSVAVLALEASELVLVLQVGRHAGLCGLAAGEFLH